MKKLCVLLIGCGLTCAACPSVAQVVVSATSSTPTLIGPVVAGQTYTVTSTGTANLNVNFNGSLGAPFNADGIPTYLFPSPYSAFYPNGLNYDPSQSSTAYAIGGPTTLYGALLGTFTASPTGYSSYFTLGSSDTFTSAVSGNLYGVVNDCANCYGDNSGGFNVTLSAVRGAVPEPGTWAMMLLGFGAIGFAMRRKPTLVLTRARGLI